MLKFLCIIIIYIVIGFIYAIYQLEKSEGVSPFVNAVFWPILIGLSIFDSLSYFTNNFIYWTHEKLSDLWRLFKK